MQFHRGLRSLRSKRRKVIRHYVSMATAPFLHMIAEDFEPLAGGVGQAQQLAMNALDVIRLAASVPHHFPVAGHLLAYVDADSHPLFHAISCQHVLCVTKKRGQRRRITIGLQENKPGEAFDGQEPVLHSNQRCTLVRKSVRSGCRDAVVD